jgi:hypothetical protein
VSKTQKCKMRVCSRNGKANYQEYLSLCVPVVIDTQGSKCQGGRIAGLHRPIGLVIPFVPMLHHSLNQESEFPGAKSRSLSVPNWADRLTRLVLAGRTARGSGQGFAVNSPQANNSVPDQGSFLRIHQSAASATRNIVTCSCIAEDRYHCNLYLTRLRRCQC